MTVRFASGEAGELDLADARARVWFEMIDLLQRTGRPVYVEIDPETTAIGEVIIPQVSPVFAVTAQPGGDVGVALITSPAIHYLRRSNPDFAATLALLEQAATGGESLLVAATVDDHEIIYAGPPPGPGAGETAHAPPAPAPSPQAETPVASSRAAQLFDAMAADTCDPCTPSGTCIPFKFPDDGCYARAHEMCRRMRTAGEDPQKVWIYGYPKGSATLHVRTANHPNCQVTWWYHVAPTLLVDTPTGQEHQVIDPSLCYEPVTVERWKAIQGDPNAILEYTTWEQFFPGGTTDPNFTLTAQYLAEKRLLLKQRCGSLPYAQCHADIYVRDNLQDTGAEPLVGGGISASPDINHFRQELAYPQGVLGTLAARDQDALFEPIEIGQPNYIYLRLQNRGWAAAPVDLDLYYSLPSTLPSPSGWQLISSLTTPPIVPGEFRVVGPIVWNQVPKQGHYCFVVVAGTAHDPKPDFSAVDTIDKFYALIREHNNVTWKNFDVFNMFAGSRQKFEFSIQGWPGRAQASDLEVDLSQLPSDCVVKLRLLKRLAQGAVADGLTLAHSTEHYVTFDAPAHECASLRNMPLRSGDRSLATLDITLPETMPDGAYQVSVQQRVQGQEMGRVTKRLLVGDYPYVANPNSGEVHLANCEWVRKMNPRRRSAYSDLELARKHGYNGCRYCLREFDTG